MPRLFAASSLTLGIAPDGIALLKPGKGQTPAITMAGHEAATTQTLPALLEGLRAKLPKERVAGAAVRIVLADHWVRLFMVTPPQNAGSLEDCRAAAMLRFQELYGESLTAWHLRADWNAAHPFLACAMPASLLDELKQLAKEFRWTLLAVAPQFVAAWNRWHKELDDNAWLGVALGSRLHLGAVEQGRLQAVSTMQIPDGAWQDGQWLSAQLAREALRLSLAAPQQLRLCGFLAGVPAGRIDMAPGCKRLDAAQSASAASVSSAANALARMEVPL